MPIDNDELFRKMEIIETLKNKPTSLELVITGRYLHPKILKIADLVSEIRQIKHYYRRGITARAGIEY